LKRRLALAVGKLTERTQQVLALYYQEECTQAEIGEILGVTESRVCQILGEATARLRALLDEIPPAEGRKARARS
jgi:RNA polymerase sigma factor for flagellar operon FliA